MKRLLLLFVLFLSSLAAQVSAPKVELSWEDAINQDATYTVKRAAGLCSGTPTFATIATGLKTKTYVDASVTAGNFCYVVTAVVNGIESAPSNASQATVPAAPPQNLQTQIK